MSVFSKIATSASKFANTSIAKRAFATGSKVATKTSAVAKKIKTQMGEINIERKSSFEALGKKINEAVTSDTNAFIKMSRSTWKSGKSTKAPTFTQKAVKFGGGAVGRGMIGGMVGGPVGAGVGAAAPGIINSTVGVAKWANRNSKKIIGASLVVGGLNGARRAAIEQAEKNTMHMNKNNSGMKSNNLSTDGLTLALSRSRHR